MSSRRRAHTYVEDADEDGNPIDETRTYVSTTPPSPSKEAANVSRTRKDKLKRGETSSPAQSNTLSDDSDSEPDLPSSHRQASKKKSKYKSREKEASRRIAASRQAAKSHKNLPHVQTTAMRMSQDDPLYYSAVYDAANPEAHVPHTWYPLDPTAEPQPQPFMTHPGVPYMLPQSHAGFWLRHPYAEFATTPASTYPPPTSMPLHGHQPPPPLDPSQAMYTSPRDYSSQEPGYVLPAVFDHGGSMSPRPPPGLGYPSGYVAQYNGGDFGQEPITRRQSMRRDDRPSMPPPQRPPRSQTARPRSNSFSAPPVTDKRRSFGSAAPLDGESLHGNSYRDLSPPERREGRSKQARRPSHEHGALYDGGHGRIAELRGSQGRRNSHLGGRNHSVERLSRDNYDSTLQYQYVMDDTPDSFTTDSSFRKTPSRGTWNLENREESSHPYVALADASVDEEMTTIHVKAGNLNLGGGVQLDITNGAVINIRPGGNDRMFRREGSDHASSVTVDELHSKVEQPVPCGRASTRTRRQSSGQAARGLPPPQANYNAGHTHQYAPYSPYYHAQYDAASRRSFLR